MLKKLGLAFALAIAAVVSSFHIAHAETGVASWYGDLRVTASGRSYSPRQAGIAAHKTLPLGSIVKVTRLSTGKSVTVQIVDRGPYIRGRIIDLTPAGARALGFYDSGLTKVRLTVLKRGNTRAFIGNAFVKKRYASASSKQRRALGGARNKKRKLG